MAIISRPAYVVGDVGKVWPEDEQAEWAHFTAPDGQEFQIKRTAPGPAKVWLLQEGVWAYEWDTGETGTLTATVPEEDEGTPAPVAPVVVAAPTAPQMGSRWRPGQ